MGNVILILFGIVILTAVALYICEQSGILKKEQRIYKYTMRVGVYSSAIIAIVLLFFQITDTITNFAIIIFSALLYSYVVYFNSKVIKRMKDMKFLYIFAVFIIELLIIFFIYILIVRQSLWTLGTSLMATGIASIITGSYNNIKSKKYLKTGILIVMTLALIASAEHFNYKGVINNKPVTYVKEYIKEKGYPISVDDGFYTRLSSGESKLMNYKSGPLRVTQYSSSGRKEFLYYKGTVEEVLVIK